MISKDKFNNAVGPQVRAKKPGVGKVIPALSLLSIGVGLAAATQYFAYDFKYQDVLGPHVNHVYAPWSILTWAAKWYGTYPEAVMRAGSIGVLASGMGLLGLAITKMIQANSSKANEYLHGSARWANKKDIQAAGLLQRDRTALEVVTSKSIPSHTGVYVGAWLDKNGIQHYLRHNGPEHILTYAPTRSGKGVGLVIPTLLSWPASTVVTDVC